jgi:hypothetical protein
MLVKFVFMILFMSERESGVNLFRQTILRGVLALVDRDLPEPEQDREIDEHNHQGRTTRVHHDGGE